MKYYLGQVSQFLQPKNKLEKAAQSYIREFDRKLIADKDIEDYKIEILANLKALNNEYPKCTIINPYWWTPAHDYNAEIKDWVIGGVDCVRFSFVCSKEVKE